MRYNFKHRSARNLINNPIHNPKNNPINNPKNSEKRKLTLRDANL